MWQLLLPNYYQKQGRGGGRPPRPSSSNLPSLKEQPHHQHNQQQEKQQKRITLRLGRQPWRGRTNNSKPSIVNHHNAHEKSSSTCTHDKDIGGENKKKTDTIARLLSLERHLENDSDELFCWTEYEEDEEAWKNDHKSPVPVTADDIKQALARFDTAIEQGTEASASASANNDASTSTCTGVMHVHRPIPCVISHNNSFIGETNRECTGTSAIGITVIGPNSLVDHNPVSALSIYTDGGNDNTDATIYTIPSLMDSTSTIVTTGTSATTGTAATHNTMPSLVDHSISTSNSMPSLLDHTVTTTNTMPSLLDHTVTTVNTMPSMLDNSVTTLTDGCDDDQLDEIQKPADIAGMTMSTDEEMGVSVSVSVDMDMTVTTAGDVDEDTIAKAVNAVLKDHHNRDFIVPATRRRESSLLVARRDSCSTISTAPDTPESPLVISEFLVGTDSPHGDFKTTTTTKNPILVETCLCPLPKCPRCTKTVWPLEFFFVHTAPLFPSNLPRIRKSKKFVPDPMTVGDFYGDDDEDIRFVPQTFEQGTPLLSNQQDDDEKMGFRLSSGAPKDEDKDDHDDTSTISTCTGDQENDGDEDELDSQIKSYSHRSGSSDIVSQMTAERTPKVRNKCNYNRCKYDQSMDEWEKNLGLVHKEDNEARPNNNMVVPYEETTGSSQPLLTVNAGNLKKPITKSSRQPKPDRHTTESFLAKLVQPPYRPTPNPTLVPRPKRLWRCPSIGLEGILPPLRHNLSFMIPPPLPPTRRTSQISGNFQVTRIEI